MAYYNCDGHITKNRVEAAWSQTHFVMVDNAGKCIKWYVDFPSVESKTCIFPLSQAFFFKCNILGDFGSKYAKGKPTNDRGNHPVPRNKFNKQQENNAIFNNVVDEIILHETQKLSAVKEAPEFLESGYDENEVYPFENMRLEDTKEKLEWRKREFECKQKSKYRVENKNYVMRMHDKEVNKIYEYNLLHDSVLDSYEEQEFWID